MSEPTAPRMGANAPAWRQKLYRAFVGRYIARRGTTPDGRFDALVSAGAQLSVLDPRGVPIDPVHACFIANWVRADSVIWDIGANMGLFALPAALKATAGHTYCFEPDVDLAYHLLKATRRPINRRLPVSVLPFALSDEDGVAEFLIADHGTSMNKLAGAGPWHDALFVTRETRRVATLRIDSIASKLRPPDIVKIDVEGAEMRVLEGGRAVIAKARPVMLVEGPKELAPQINAYLKALDYVILDGEVEKPVPLDSIVWDTVAVPKEKWR